MYKLYYIVSFGFLLAFTACITPSKLCDFNNIIKNNVSDNEMRIIKPDSVYLEWINHSIKKKPKINYCIQITDSVYNDTAFVREYYSEKIYFVGKIHDNRKVGYWNGYFVNNKIVETAYTGEGQNSPTFLKLFNKKGDGIQHYSFGLDF